MFWVTMATTTNFLLDARFAGAATAATAAVPAAPGATAASVTSDISVTVVTASGFLALRPRPRPDILLTLNRTILFRLVSVLNLMILSN